MQRHHAALHAPVEMKATEELKSVVRRINAGYLKEDLSTIQSFYELERRRIVQRLFEIVRKGKYTIHPIPCQLEIRDALIQMCKLIPDNLMAKGLSRKETDNQ